jgi:serine protease Do
MLKNFNGRPSLATVLKASTVAGIAAAVLATGVPLEITRSYAEAVKVQAPAVPSFANVVDAVSPAVVSVRVENRVNPVADNNEGFSFDFNGRGFDDLPDDHPLKRFFKQFGQDPNDQQGHQRRFGQNGPNGGPNGPGGKGRLRPVAQGSGFFISEDGYIVTNNHVVSDGQAFVAVMNDGTEFDAKLIGKDPRTDLAVLKVDGKGKKFTYVNWANDNNVRVGDWVVAVGNPFGLGGTVTAGIISARGRDIGSGPYDDYLQVDAAVNRGNSGGPTFNLSGEVVGINTAIFSPSGGSVGIGFAIASNQAKQIVNQLMEHGTVDRGFLGVSIQPIDPDLAKALKLDDTHGALVSKVEPDSPAAKAGVKSRDVILQFDGKEVEKPSQLSRYVAGTQAGKSSELVLWRDGKRETLQVDVGKMPSKEMASNEQGGDQPDSSQPKLGLSLAPLTPDTRDQLNLDQKVEGVVVTQVQPDSPADQKGIQPGDIIVSVNQKAVKDPRQVQDAVKKAHEAGDQTVLMLLMRDGQQIFEAVPLAAS